MFYNIWDKMESSDYEKPSKSWIPEDTKYRFEWEGQPKPLDKKEII